MINQDSENDKKQSSTRFENPWGEMFKNMKPLDFSNPQEFTKSLVDGITDFYKQTMKMNPLLEQAAEAMQQNKVFFENVDYGKKVAFFAEINTIAAQMIQVIVQKQQKYINTTFQEMVSFIKDVKENQGNSDFFKQYQEKAKVFSEQAREHFSEISNIVLETGKKINGLFAEFCDDLRTCCDGTVEEFDMEFNGDELDADSFKDAEKAATDAADA
jgi:predicted ATP-binding protein involved in virulence